MKMYKAFSASGTDSLKKSIEIINNEHGKIICITATQTYIYGIYEVPDGSV